VNNASSRDVRAVRKYRDESAADFLIFGGDLRNWETRSSAVAPTVEGITIRKVSSPASTTGTHMGATWNR